MSKIKEKTKSLYRNKKEPYNGKLFLREDSDEAWEFIDELEYSKLSNKDKEKVKLEEVEFCRPWWNLQKHVESISTKMTLTGGSERDSVAYLENRIRYFLKKCSFIDLEFDKDESGFERIKPQMWEKIVGKEGLAPEILTGILRVFVTKSPV